MRYQDHLFNYESVLKPLYTYFPVEHGTLKIINIISKIKNVFRDKKNVIPTGINITKKIINNLHLLSNIFISVMSLKAITLFCRHRTIYSLL
jgi:hypothetical protein